MSPQPAVESAAHATTAVPAPIPEPSLQVGWPIALIGALAVTALLLTRRRRRQGRWVKVLETTSLGPRRSLVVAQLGGETVLLATSEAGITLLKAGLTPEPVAEPTPSPSPVPPGLFQRTTHEAAFEDLLAESAEDQELRRKLAAGQPARVS